MEFSRQWILSNGGELLPSQNIGYFGRSVRRGAPSGESGLAGFRIQLELLPVDSPGSSRSTPLQEGLRPGKSSPREFRRPGIASVLTVLPMDGFLLSGGISVVGFRPGWEIFLPRIASLPGFPPWS